MDVGNNVFVGAETVILPGVKIGNNVIIGANSTVTHDIPDGSVAVGSPAKVLCTLEQYLEKEKKRMETAPCYDESFTLRGGITEDRKLQQKSELENTIGYVE